MAALLVEHLKVLISRACLRILNSRAPAGPYGRAPKGPFGRAPLGFTYWVGGLLVESAYASLLVERAYAP